MKNTKTRFVNLLNHFGSFNQFEFLFAHNRNETTVFTGFGSKKNILIVATMPEDQNFERKVCLSDLPFLKKLFELEAIQNDTGTVQFIPGKDLEGNEILQTIMFNAPKMSVSYATTDPRVLDNGNKPPSSVKANWVTDIELNPSQYKTFQEAYTLQKMMAKKEEDRIAKFYFENGNMMIELPYTRSDKVTMVFAEGVEEFKVRTTYSSDIISTMLGIMANDGAGRLYLSDTMFRIDTVSDDIDFKMYTTPTS